MIIAHKIIFLIIIIITIIIINIDIKYFRYLKSFGGKTFVVKRQSEQRQQQIAYNKQQIGKSTTKMNQSSRIRIPTSFTYTQINNNHLKCILSSRSTFDPMLSDR
uniref:Uncharacterized protein LOC113795662 n=1 Tax=Dermatophagoides pteronyssinus TaxID=6956 RepID=A0A6P6YAP4_DERPT|nr:uncharacterized protein LOC113795662 [Dermatophagoides pteronyssinus]